MCYPILIKKIERDNRKSDIARPIRSRFLWNIKTAKKYKTLLGVIQKQSTLGVFKLG